jgi:hypothetical protein
MQLDPVRLISLTASAAPTRTPILRRVAQAGKELTAASRAVQGYRDDQEWLADWKKTPLCIDDGENGFCVDFRPSPTWPIEHLIEDETQRVRNYSRSVALAEPKLRESTDALQHLAGDELLAELLRECRARLPEINQHYKNSIIDGLERIAALNDPWGSANQRREWFFRPALSSDALRAPRALPARQPTNRQFVPNVKIGSTCRLP